MRRLMMVTLRFFFPFGRRHGLDFVSYLILFLLFFFPLGGWKLVTSEINASEEDRVYGETYDVPELGWAQVVNRYGVNTVDTEIRRFENCIVRYRGQVREIINHWTWWSTINDEALVEYTVPEAGAATGVLCPSGTVFYISHEELDLYPERFQQRQAAEGQIRDEVAAALENSQPGSTYPVEDFFTWIEVLNADGVENFGFSVGFLDICGIEVLGEIQEIGQTQWGTLYEYVPDPERGLVGVGIPCPANTLFLLDGSLQVSNDTKPSPSA